MMQINRSIIFTINQPRWWQIPPQQFDQLPTQLLQTPCFSKRHLRVRQHIFGYIQGPVCGMRPAFDIFDGPNGHNPLSIFAISSLSASLLASFSTIIRFLCSTRRFSFLCLPGFTRHLFFFFPSSCNWHSSNWSESEPSLICTAAMVKSQRHVFFESEGLTDSNLSFRPKKRLFDLNLFHVVLP